MKCFCVKCNLIGGYCSIWDGYHWRTKHKGKAMENLSRFNELLSGSTIVYVGSDFIDPSDLKVDMEKGEIYLGDHPLNVYRIEEAKDSSNVLILHCEDEHWDGANMVFIQSRNTPPTDSHEPFTFPIHVRKV